MLFYILFSKHSFRSCFVIEMRTAPEDKIMCYEGEEDHSQIQDIF